MESKKTKPKPKQIWGNQKASYIWHLYYAAGKS